MNVGSHIPVRIILYAVSAGNVVIQKDRGMLKLPETWLRKGETLCQAGERLARETLMDRHIKPIAVVWFTEAGEGDNYHLVFAVETFLDTDVTRKRDILMLRISDAAKLVDDPVHREFLEYMCSLKPRPLLTCSI